MARLTPPPGGERASGTPEERWIVDLLVRELPDTYTVIPNLLLSRKDEQPFDYAAVVVAPHAVYVIEVRGWQGRITGDQYEWLLDGRRRPSPVLLAERKAKALKIRLTTHAHALGRVPVEALVVLAGKDLSLELSGEDRHMVVRPSELVSKLTDPARVGQDAEAIVGLLPLVHTAILHRANSRPAVLRFRDYEVIETLQQSDGEVLYRAKRIDMPAAPEVRLRVVTVPPRLAGGEEPDEQEAPLFRDVEALLRMGAHPNVVTARDAFRDDGRVVVVLDADDSRSLRQRLATGTPLTIEERLGVLVDVCRGLAHAHANGVIHRLVTPSHVLLGDDGRARLAHFGLAKLDAEGSSTVWNLEAVDPPDLPYLAPELRHPVLGPAGPATDLYGLGRIAWELFAGAGGPALGAAPPSGMPADLADLVTDLLQEHPGARLASASEALAALERLRGSGEPSTTGPKAVYEVGDVIDNEFEVRDRLGAGGFRTVYRVYRALHDSEFALKLYNSGGFADVRREISILQGIEHPNVERVVWADQTSHGQWYLVTRLLDGEPLTDYAKGVKRLSVEEALRVGDQLLAALERIHPNERRLAELHEAAAQRDLSEEEAQELLELRGSGIVHRDVKPHNLMLTRDGAVLIDFNIASLAGDPVQTQSGTPPYTPPDADQGQWTPSVDLFGAGVTLYELVCCQHPYEHGVPSATRRPIDPRTFRPDLAPALANFLVKACAPLAEQRFANAAEMRDALAAIETPVVPVAAKSAVGAPTRLADLIRAAPPNVNPMVTEFLALSSQARRSNGETRGLSELARSTYVETKLDQDLTEAVLAGRHRLVIVTGNAGDGKTAFIQQTEDLAGERGAEVEARGPNGSVLRLGRLVLRTLYDGSQDEDGRSSDEALAGFLAPFAVGGQDDGAIRLAAVNEGRLRDFIGEHRERFPGLVGLLAELDDPGRGGGDVTLVNLNLRSVTAGGETSIFSRQMRAIVGGPFWGSCQECDYRARCPIKHNVDTFADPVSGEEVTERLRRLVELVRLRRRRHLTMRDVRSLIAHVLFRDRDCHEIADLLDSADDMAVVDLAYFQAPGGLGAPSDSALERGAELLAEADVAAVANPADDRALAAGRGPARMGFPRRESDYPHELLVRAYGGAGTGAEANATQARRAHAGLRRLVFFERRDRGWLHMLPYRRLTEFEGALDPAAEQVRAELRDQLVRALSTVQGLLAPPDGQPGLWLAAGDGADGVRGYRRLPAEEFEVRIAAQDLPYVEVEPDRLNLVHRPSGTTLSVDLDVIELLERLREGYVPSADEARGLLVQVELFLNRLRALASTELLLVTGRGLLRIVARPGGQVELAEVASS